MNEEVKSKCFDDSINKFLTHIESIWTSLPIVFRTIEVSSQQAMKKHSDFLTKDCVYVKSENHFIIPAKHRRKNEILRKAATNSIVAANLIKRNFLVSLVSQFDTYISDMIKAVFLIRPDLISESEKKLTYSDLSSFDSIESVKSYIIEKEIETVLRKSYTDQFIWFENKLSLQLRKDLPSWSTFIELTQRRNLFVHNDGKISSQYLTVCRENKVDLSSSSIDQELSVDLDYFEVAFITLFELGVKMNQVIRRNLLKKELEHADKSFLDISFELVQNRQYELAKELYDFSDKYINKFSNEDLRLRIILNRAQAYKWLGDNDKCLEIVSKEDWSAKSNLFRMVSSVLLDDFEQAINFMRIIGDNPNVIAKEFYKQWPIFKEFRKDTAFKEAYQELYEEPFEFTEEKK